MENIKLRNENNPQKRISTQMRAVLTLLQSDQELLRAVNQHIDLNTESIYWDQIFAKSWSSGQRALLTWGFNLWRDENRKGASSFELALGMDQKFQLAILNALAVRWGIQAA